MSTSSFTSRRRIICAMTSIAIASGLGAFTASTAEARQIAVSLVEQSAPNFASSDADSARNFSSFLLKGVARDEKGDPVANASFTVSLEPSRRMQVADEEGGSDAVGFSLLTTSTGNDGSFSFRVPALKDVKNYLDEQNTILLWVNGGNDKAVISHRYEVVPPVSVGDPVRAIFTDEAMKTTRSAVANSGSTSSNQLSFTEEDSDNTPPANSDEPEVTATRVPTADAGLDEFDPPAYDIVSLNLPAHSAEQPTTSTSLMAGDNPHTACVQSWPNKEYTNQYKFEREGNSKRSWIRVQTIHTGTKMTAEFNWKNTKETRLSIGVSAAYRGVTFGASREVSRVASSGVTYAVRKNVRRILQAEWDIREYRLYCNFRDSGWTIGFYTEMRPYGFTGGNQSNTSASADIGCTHRVNTGNTLWVSRESSHPSSFTIAAFPINLGATQTNTNQHVKTFKGVGRICGDGGYPVDVDRVKEVAG